MPLEVVVELQIRAVFENAVDPGAVADLLEMWEELAYYEKNTRDFLFPEPKLTPPHPGIYREVLMKTAIGFPGIAPKLEFATRTAIRECVFLHRNRFLEERYKSQRPLSTSHRPTFPLNNTKMMLKENNLDRMPTGVYSRVPSPCSMRRCFLDQPAHFTLGNNFKISAESKPPFVVRHVDSAKPFGENNSEHYSRKSRRKAEFSNFPFPMRRASSLGSLAANVKVIKEPDERIILRRRSPSPLDSSKFGKRSPRNQGDADCYRESFATSQHSRTPSPQDQLLFRERFRPCSQPTWKKIHERVCRLLASHRAQQHPDTEDSAPEINYILERPSCPLEKYPQHEQRYF